MAASSPSSAPSPAQREQLRAADQVMNLFAQESLLALKALEDSFPPDSVDKAQRVGERLAYHWTRYGLDEVALGKDCGEAQRLLWAAAKVATAPDSRGLRTADLEQAGRPGTIERLSADLDRRFGAELPVPHPNQWLDESLSRLAKASVLQEVVRLDAKVTADVSARDAAHPSSDESVQQAAADFVRQGQRLDDQSREVSAAASTLGKEEPNYFRGQSLLVGAWATSTAATALIEPWWARLAVHVPVTGYLIQQGAEAFWERRDLQRLVGAGQSELRSVRTDLISTLDKAPTGRPDSTNLRTGRGPDGGAHQR